MGSMTEYREFLGSKRRTAEQAGFEPTAVLPDLFPFQDALVRWACRRGRAALFADTGLGKTMMQLAWADEVVRHSRRPVLILAPLAVSEQTVREAECHGLRAEYVRASMDFAPGIYVTNYEMLHEFDLGCFGGVVLDESSILKHHDSKARTALIDAAQQVPYRLSCTATPSPNDLMELANQAEFLGVMTRAEMLAEFFTHDGGDTQKWRLKNHGRRDFWAFLASWAAVVRLPSDLGFEDDGYRLPPLNKHEHVVRSASMLNGELFPRAAQTLTEQRQAKRKSLDERVAGCAALVNRTPGPWIVWCHLNDESAALVAAIDGAEEVRGSHSLEEKRRRLDDFSSRRLRVLVTKPSIAGFGLNWQHCGNMAFVGLNHSFEQFYQACRRCWRFGRAGPVDAHIFTADSEGQILESIRRKERQHEQVSVEMVGHMRGLMQAEIMGERPADVRVESGAKEAGEGWSMHLGDCVEVVRGLEPDSIDYSVFSPPFASLYTYTDSERDMGNSRDDDEFHRHFGFLVDELLRVIKPGRLLSFHCMNLPTVKVREGFIGIRDFRGDLIRLFVERGWIYHSEVCIWKDPVTAMQRTKALGLLHKQLKKDACMSRMGIPDYVVTMRKPGENPEPVTNTNQTFPVERWQRYASPIWTDIRPNRTLAFRQARENDDERHICPLQLDVIERCVGLWTNEGDVVLSPFAGIGSEGYVAVQMNRQFVGVELKRSYWDAAVRHLRDARIDQGDMFG